MKLKQKLLQKTTLYKPDFYGLTKLMSERLLDLRDILPSVSIRLPGIIGPGSQRNWLSNLKKSSKPISILLCLTQKVILIT